MTDWKLSQLTTLGTVAASTQVPVLDPSDTSTAPAGPAGSDKIMTVGTLARASVGIASLGRLSSSRRRNRWGAAVNSAPTLSVSTTAIAGASFTPAATSSVPTANPPWRYEGIAPFAPFGSSAFVTPKFAGAAQPVPFRVSWDFYGSQFAVQTFGSDYEFLIWINDQPITSAPTVLPNDSATHWAIVTLPAIGHYRVTFEASAGPSSTCYFGGVAALPSYDVRPPADPSPLRMAIVGDSYGCGKGAGNISASPNPYSVYGYVPLLSQLLGIPDTWSFSIGGTGYVNAGPATAYSGRASDVVAAAPNVVIVQGSINDGGLSGVQAAAQSFVGGLQSSLPNAIIVMTGPLYAATYATGYTVVATAVQAAATAQGVPFVDASTWAVSGGNVSSPTGTGDSDYYLNADSIHPTFAGHQMIAQRLAAAVSPLLGLDAG